LHSPPISLTEFAVDFPPSTLSLLLRGVGRVAAETTTLGKYTVEKGTIVQADVITLHRNKQIWGQDADEFRPERWTEDGFTQPQAYYPFGGGPRICIGMRLAMMELKSTLVQLLKRFRLSKCPKTEASHLIWGRAKTGNDFLAF
jgi:cytochrome P450